MTRDSRLILRITEPLHDLLRDTAQRSSRTVSEVARDILIDAMAEGVVRRGEQLEGPR